MVKLRTTILDECQWLKAFDIIILECAWWADACVCAHWQLWQLTMKTMAGSIVSTHCLLAHGPGWSLMVPDGSS